MMDAMKGIETRDLTEQRFPLALSSECGRPLGSMLRAACWRSADRCVLITHCYRSAYRHPPTGPVYQFAQNATSVDNPRGATFKMSVRLHK